MDSLDYADRRFPNSACITDYVRCSLCFEDCISLLNGISIFTNAVEKGDTCLKKIIRIKNMFASSKRQFEKANGGNKNKDKDKNKNDRSWLLKYGDIKMNVMMQYDNKSMICEVCKTKLNA